MKSNAKAHETTMIRVPLPAYVADGCCLPSKQTAEEEKEEESKVLRCKGLLALKARPGLMASQSNENEKKQEDEATS